jgi:hypothetical protein
LLGDIVQKPDVDQRLVNRRAALAGGRLRRLGGPLFCRRTVVVIIGERGDVEEVDTMFVLDVGREQLPDFLGACAREQGDQRHPERRRAGAAARQGARRSMDRRGEQPRQILQIERVAWSHVLGFDVERQTAARIALDVPVVEREPHQL